MRNSTPVGRTTTTAMPVVAASNPYPNVNRVHSANGANGNGHAGAHGGVNGVHSGVNGAHSGVNGVHNAGANQAQRGVVQEKRGKKRERERDGDGSGNGNGNGNGVRNVNNNGNNVNGTGGAGGGSGGGGPKPVVSARAGIAGVRPRPVKKQRVVSLTMETLLRFFGVWLIHFIFLWGNIGHPRPSEGCYYTATAYAYASRCLT